MPQPTAPKRKSAKKKQAAAKPQIAARPPKPEPPVVADPAPNTQLPSELWAEPAGADVVLGGIPLPTAMPANLPPPVPESVNAAYIPEVEPVRRAPRARRPGVRRTTSYPPLSREQEYSYIRADLRRLLYTAGPLLVAMLVLLVVLER